MGISDEDSETLLNNRTRTTKTIPKDTFHLAYIIYFTLGAGYLIPWNSFVTAVDYFVYLYPDASVDRIFGVVYMLVGLTCLLFIVFFAHVTDARVRINVGLGLFVCALLVVPVMDVVYVKGRVGLYSGFYVTVGAVVVSGIGDALVQSGVVGNAGELPERYMQATVAGTAASGVLISLLRIFTKAVYPQDSHGLRRSAILYFTVSILVMIVCIVFYNIVHRLPIVKYYNDLKSQALIEDKEERGPLTGSVWRSTLFAIVKRIKWYCFAVFIIYLVTLSIFPGYITEDVHSQILKDWYPVILITCYNVFDLVGKSLTSIYAIENEKIVIGASVARLLFYPLFLGCLHGPKFFRTEIPVIALTGILGFTNGYFTSVLFMMAPKVVPLHHSETAGTVIVLFLAAGLGIGSIVSWFWVI